jgi:ribose-phosphate pyrophosphokinase
MINGHYNNFTTMKFSGGEIQVRLEEGLARTIYQSQIGVGIHAKIKSSDDLMELLLLTDAIRRTGNKTPIKLQLPYIPYARQDRVCYPGEALSLKVFCDIINAQKYDTVQVYDAHSDVALALLDNVVHVESFRILYNNRRFFPEDVVLVSPDAGAMKKVTKCAEYLEKEMVVAKKIRDPKTGNITGTDVDMSTLDCPLGRKWLIVDDICDGGRTFIELAKRMNEMVSHNGIDLYVTHGIFSKGFDVFRETVPGKDLPLINHIYVANSFVDDVPSFVTKILP